MEGTQKYKLKRIGFVSAAVILVYGLEFFSHSLYLLGVFSKKWLAFVRSGATPEEAAREGRLALDQSRRREEAPFIHRVSAASPTCTITAPSAGATVSGSATSVTATASGSGAETVQFYLDVNPATANADIANGILPTANRLGSLDTSNPFGITWNTTTASNGSHTLACVTTNQYGGTDRTLSALVTVTVDNGGDTTAPTIAQVTAVSSPTNDTTPNYTFSSTEAGTITYGGSCASATTSATSGNNTIAFNALSAGTYSNCTIRVMDVATNQSNLLTVNTFTIDTTAPTIASVNSTTPNGTYGVSDTINVTVNFSKAVTSTGNVTVTLETGTVDRTCTFTVSNASSGSCTYTVQAGDTSADLTTSSVTGTIADQAGNSLVNFAPATTLAANKALVIDTTPPGAPTGLNVE